MTQDSKIGVSLPRTGNYPQGLVNGYVKENKNRNQHMIDEKPMINGSFRTQRNIKKKKKRFIKKNDEPVNMLDEGHMDGCIYGCVMERPQYRQYQSEWKKGSGLINGNGASYEPNGAMKGGFVNGFRTKHTQDYEVVHVTHSKYFKTRYRQKRVWETVGVLTFFTILAIIPFATTYGIHHFEKIAIDGNFDDWQTTDVAMLTESKYFTNSDVNNHIKIEKYASLIDNKKMYIYLNTNQTMINGKGNYTDQIHIFIDNDNNSETGYKIRGIGAEFRIQVSGIWGIITKSFMSEYVGNNGRQWDWNTGSQIPTRIKNNNLEMGFAKYLVGKANSYKIVIANIDQNGNMAMSSIFDTNGKIIKSDVANSYIQANGDDYGGIIIDGSFDDWNDVIGTAYGEKDERLGIVEQKEVIALKAVSIYLKTNGTIFQGEIPDDDEEQNNETEPIDDGKGGKGNLSEQDKLIPKPIIQKETNITREGNDTAVIKFGNNYRILVRGVFEDIYQSDFQEFNNTEWKTIGNVQTASVGSEMETQLTDMDTFEIANLTFDRITFFVTDWKGHYDFVSKSVEKNLSFSKGGMQTSSIGHEMSPEYVVAEWSVQYEGTAYSSQRHCFRDKWLYYWILYQDSDGDVNIIRSDDTAGSGYTTTYTFSSAVSGIAMPSLWYNEDTTLYVVWTESYDIKIAKCDVSNANPYLTIGTTYVAIDGSGTGIYYDHPFVSLSSGGYIWVSAGHLHTNYKCSVARSSATNNPSTFDAETDLMTGGSTNTLPTAILPFSSGNNMYAIWQKGTGAGSSDFQGELYSSGAWSGSIQSIGQGLNADNVGFSACVIGSDYISMVYINADGKLVYNKRTATTWTGEGEIDTTITCKDCTLTKDNGNNLYLFYLIGTSVYYRSSTNGGTTWSGSSTIQTGLSGIRYLNSPYYTSTKIIYVWTQSNSVVNADYQDLIPDMPEIIKMALPPFIGITAIAINILRKKYKNKLTNVSSH